MNKRYIVRLSDEERETLRKIISRTGGHPGGPVQEDPPIPRSGKQG